MLMEAENSHNLLSANWTPRTAGIVIQFKSEDLRTRAADGVNPSPGAREDEKACPSSVNEAGEE